MNAKKFSFPVLLKSLAAGTAIATVFCVLWNLHAPRDWLLSAAITFGTTCYHLTMRLLVGFIGSHIPIRENSRWFQPRPFEQKLYRVLRVKRWKSAMPTYDPDSFSLQKNTLEQVIRNSCTRAGTYPHSSAQLSAPICRPALGRVPGVSCYLHPGGPA